MSVAIDIEYLGGLKTQATHGPSSSTLTTAAPVDNQGDGSSFSPTDLLATALGTCIVTIVGIAARGRDVDVTGTQVNVLKEMTAQPPRRVGRLTVTLDLPDSVPEEHRAALEEAGRGCPVCRSLSNEMEVDVTFRWTAQVA
ncbi:MAG: OsmC family protein, partial [Acidobacteriota bacterium]